MKGKRIEEIGVSSRGMYMRNIADIIRSDMCSNADVPELSEIALRIGR